VDSDAAFETLDARSVLSRLSPVSSGPETQPLENAGALAPENRRAQKKMSDAYVVEVGGQTAGIVVRDNAAETFSFFAATRRFNALEGLQFTEPYAAERAARQLITGFAAPLQTAPASLLE
jgi:hypothetical protein